MCCESSALPVDPVVNPNQAVIDKLQVNELYIEEEFISFSV